MDLVRAQGMYTAPFIILKKQVVGDRYEMLSEKDNGLLLGYKLLLLLL